MLLRPDGLVPAEDGLAVEVVSSRYRGGHALAAVRPAGAIDQATTLPVRLPAMAAPGTMLRIAVTDAWVLPPAPARAEAAGAPVAGTVPA